MTFMQETHADALPSSALDVHAGQIHAVGGSVPASMPLSIFPSGVAGWLPMQGYVLREGDQLMMLDTGVTRHKEQIRSALGELVKGTRTRNLLLSRREHDVAINLPWIVGDFAFQKVIVGGDLNPLDFFESMDDASAFEQLRAASGIEVEFVRTGAVVSLGSLRMEALPVTMRVLTTHWYYEHSSKTLFSSDSFGFVTSRDDVGPCKRTPTDEEISAERIMHYMSAKFDWICGIDTKPIIDGFLDAVRDREIDRVCPSLGVIIEGPDAVAKLFDQTVIALEKLAAAPRKPMMEGVRF